MFLRILFCFLFFSKAFAVEIYNIYDGSCSPQTGVVIDAHDSFITMILLNGKVRKIPRYEILAMAKYHIDNIPLSKISQYQYERESHTGEDVQKEETSYFKITTFKKNEYKILVEGWPVAFTQKDIQFLSIYGETVVIKRSDIWKLERELLQKDIVMTKEGEPLSLKHPVLFDSCNIETKKGVPPSSVISELVHIKNTLDFYTQEYQKMRMYEDVQRFYEVPEYKYNNTYLGSWILLKSYYSNAGNRQVNFLPSLRSEFSSGPFGFQSLITSGVSPQFLALHGEPIMQTSLWMKSDYILLSLFFDPMSALLGDKYSWEEQHLNSFDFKWIQPFGLQLGIDWNFFSVGVAATSVKVAVKSQKKFFSESFEIPFLYLKYQKEYIKWHLLCISEFNTDKWNYYSKSKLDFYKFQLEAPFLEGDTKVSFIYRNLIGSVSQSDSFKDHSLQFSIDYGTHLWDRYYIQGIFNLERHSILWDFASHREEKTSWHPMLATAFFIYF